VKWLVRLALTAVACYAALFGTVLFAMNQTPGHFGQFMRHMPGVLVWGALPAQRMWLWSREGTLKEGDEAPMFTLSTYNHQSQVSLASYRGDRPVVLVFGSYT
jgi:hypothetical protein